MKLSLIVVPCQCLLGCILGVVCWGGSCCTVELLTCSTEQCLCRDVLAKLFWVLCNDMLFGRNCLRHTHMWGSKSAAEGTGSGLLHRMWQFLQVLGFIYHWGPLRCLVSSWGYLDFVCCITLIWFGCNVELRFTWKVKVLIDEDLTFIKSPSY